RGSNSGGGGGEGLATLAKTMPHPFAAAASEIAAAVAEAMQRHGDPLIDGNGIAEAPVEGTRTLRLPCHEDDPLPSPHVAHTVGHTLAEDMDAVAVLRMVDVPAVRVPAQLAPAVLEALDELAAAQAAARDGAHQENGFSAGGNGHAEGAGGPSVVAGSSLRFFAAAARFLRRLLAQQRCVPTLAQDAAGQVEGLWQPWLADKPTLEGLQRLLDAMPPIARSGVDGFSHEPWPILEDFLLRTGDAA